MTTEVQRKNMKEERSFMSTLRTTNTSLIILNINMFIAMLGIGLVIPVLPQFMQEFGESGTALGYLVSATGLTHFLFSPLGGKMSDQYGRKIIIISGLGLFAMSQFIFAIAHDMWMLYLSRLIGGVGIAFMISPIMAAVADITNNENRGKGLARLGAAMSLGFVIGPGIGGFLAEYGLRVPFYVATAVAVFSLVVSILILPETLTQEKQLAVRKSQSKGNNIFRQFMLSFKATYLFLLILTFTLTFGLASFDAVFGLYLVIKYGYTPQDIALLITAGALMSVIIQAKMGDGLLRRFKEQKLMNICLVLCILCLLLMLLSGEFWYVFFIILLFFSVIAILRLSINTLLSKMAGPEQGFVAGMNNAYMGLGNIVGPAISGVLFDIHIDLPYLLGALIILMSLLLSVFCSGNRKDSCTAN